MRVMRITTLEETLKERAAAEKKRTQRLWNAGMGATAVVSAGCFLVYPAKSMAFLWQSWTYLVVVAVTFLTVKRL